MNSQNFDKELFNLIKKEKKRQKNNLNLIASENIMLNVVKKCLNNCLNNKYSEGYLNKRYYGGVKYIEQIENLAIKRTLDAFNLTPEEWGVNVQCYSGSIANFAVYNALCNPEDTILGLNLFGGGHLSHGYSRGNKPISASAKYFNSVSYNVDNNGFIDYDDLEFKAKFFKPKIIIAGTSAYSQLINYKKIKEICNIINCYLLVDISHIAGFMVTNLIPKPFKYADVVMSTTHKTLKGPRGSIIIYKKHLESQINSSVFPSLQGGPHNNTIAAIAALMKETKSKNYISYQKKVLINSKKLVFELKKKNFNIVTKTTKNHMFLIDLKNKNITGKDAEFILEKCRIVCNKNYIYTDIINSEASGIRIGLSFITSQNYNQKDMIKISEFIDNAISITQEYKKNEYKLNKNIKTNIKFLNKKILSFILNKNKIMKK